MASAAARGEPAVDEADEQQRGEGCAARSPEDGGERGQQSAAAQYTLGSVTPPQGEMQRKGQTLDSPSGVAADVLQAGFGPDLLPPYRTIMPCENESKDGHDRVHHGPALEVMLAVGVGEHEEIDAEHEDDVGHHRGDGAFRPLCPQQRDHLPGEEDDEEPEREVEADRALLWPHEQIGDEQNDGEAEDQSGNPECASTDGRASLSGYAQQQRHHDEQQTEAHGRALSLSCVAPLGCRLRVGGHHRSLSVRLRVRTCASWY